MKKSVQIFIRNFHRRFLTKSLPRQVAIYLHAIEPTQTDSLRECLSFWKDQGFNFVNATDLCKTGSRKRIFVSFDDNYRSWHDLLPILNDLSVKVTFYVNTLPFRDVVSPQIIDDYFDRLKYRGERATLSTEELMDLTAAGHVVGCHSHSHFTLSRLPAEVLEQEIDGSKQIIEDLIGQEVVDFAYPFGMRRHFSKRLQNYCFDRGFHTIANGIPGLQYARQFPQWINRTPWNLNADLLYNVESVCIDGRIFERLTGRSASI